MNGITKGERLALLIAIDKRLKPELDEAKAEARQDVMEAMQADGTDRKAILVGGEKVGEVGVSYSKAAPYIYRERMTDALDFLSGYGLVDVTPKKGWEAMFDLVGGEVVYKPTGEVVDWAGWQGKTPKSAAIRGCKPDDVLKAFGQRLAGVDALALIEGGAE